MKLNDKIVITIILRLMICLIGYRIIEEILSIKERNFEDLHHI